MSSAGVKLQKLKRKVIVAIPLLGVALAMTLAYPWSFAALVAVAGSMSLLELVSLVREHGIHWRITREAMFVVGGLGAAAVLRFVSLDMTLAIGLGAIANDIAASLTGMAIGRRFIKRGLSRHSPNKSWEGAVAGVAAGTFAFCHFAGFGWWQVVVGLVTNVAGVLGDLQESAMKRSLEIKDVGSSLGEHGGWTDRIDNMTRSFVVGTILIVLLQLPMR